MSFVHCRLNVLLFIVFLLLGLSGGKGGCPRVSTQGTSSGCIDKFFLHLNETFFGGGDRGQY